MTDKVQKIRKEVEKLHGNPYYMMAVKDVLKILDMQEEPVSEVWHDASKKPNIKDKGSVFVITSLNGEYIGSRYYNRNDITINFGNYDKWAYLNDLLKLSNLERIGKNWKEEPVSEDLEEAAWLQYDKNKPLIPPELDLHKEFIDFFKAGVRWQKSKDESFTKELEEASKKYSSCIYLEEVLSDDDKEVLKERLINTFKAGAKWGKNQAMAEIQAQSMALAHGCPKEPVKEDLEEAAIRASMLKHDIPKEHLHEYLYNDYGMRKFVEGAKWQEEKDDEEKVLTYKHGFDDCKEYINEILLSEVLPCFMHGGEADEVVAKLDEVLNQKK